MNIEVSPELLELIKTVEERERKTHDYPFDFSWAYYPNGQGATGQAYGNYPHAEFDLSIIGGLVSAQRRELDKWSNEEWATDPLDSDYEAEEDEEGN